MLFLKLVEKISGQKIPKNSEKYVFLKDVLKIIFLTLILVDQIRS
jgi:hypothetical protein